MPTPSGRATLHDGHAAETRACHHLEERGLILIARNYRSRFGEIDLVMREDQTLVFVEVRRRGSDAFGTPAETVGTRKRQRLRATAEQYLQQHPQQSQNACRFDIVAITDGGPTARIEWLRNAF